MRSRDQLCLNGGVISGERRDAVVAVRQRLLADAIARFLASRGLDVRAPYERSLVDLVVTAASTSPFAGRVVVTLPRQPGERGSVMMANRAVDLTVSGVNDLDAVIDLLVP